MSSNITIRPGVARLQFGAFPIFDGVVDALPHGVRGLLITSDLQSFDRNGPGGNPRLLGKIVRDEVCQCRGNMRGIC